MKTPDNYFRGFPTLWNAVVFYLFVLKPAPWLAAICVVVLAALTFVPFKFVHPMRVARMRALTMSALVLWLLLAFLAVRDDLDPGPWVAGALVVVAVYFVAIGLTERR